MAYMSQENKKSKEPLLKAILKKYGLKGSVGVKHYSTIVLAFSIDKLPSGMMVYTKTVNGGTVEEMQHQGTHPVIEAMKQEHAEIEEFCKRLNQKP
jgi:hypothetical protein